MMPMVSTGLLLKDPLRILVIRGEVNKLISMTIGEGERYIISLYHGLDNESLGRISAKAQWLAVWVLLEVQPIYP
ncbi:hypothetical protein HanOQP8_Chr03g0110381 [Helianthus annuus]|nr:hypothetical protein HanOQP8_Chr03g0110381 [Helianthus annuus]